MDRLYLDHATTTPLDPRVREAMLPCLGERFGSPLAGTERGRDLRRMIEETRRAVADLLGAPASDILFTSSATEANNLAIKGLARAARGPRRLLAAATEHISVLHPLRSLEREGFEVELLPVGADGVLDPSVVERALRRPASLLSVAHASAEIGTLQLIEEIARVARARDVPLHCDATASAGLVPLPPGESLPDLVSLAPHLFGGPSGVAALRVASGRRLSPLLEGGPQEGGLRAGAQSMADLAGFGAAARLALGERRERSVLAAALAVALKDRLGDIAGLAPTGHAERRLPGHVSLTVRGIEAEPLLRDLDAAGIEAASGSACVTEAGKPSHVLTALGIEPDRARGALVFMFGRGNGPDDPARAAQALRAAIGRLRALSPFETA